MIFEDDMPQKTGHKPKLLDDMSVAELEDYVSDLKAEILRVEAEISKKQTHAQTAAALFGKNNAK